MQSKPFIYCFIRKDLSAVQQIIQMSHACFEAGGGYLRVESPNICLFEVQDEGELWEVEFYLTEHSVPFVRFQEPDLNDEFTAICTQIVDTEEKRAIFRKFNLYRE